MGKWGEWCEADGKCVALVYEYLKDWLFSLYLSRWKISSDNSILNADLFADEEFI